MNTNYLIKLQLIIANQRHFRQHFNIIFKAKFRLKMAKNHVPAWNAFTILLIL